MNEPLLVNEYARRIMSWRAGHGFSTPTNLNTESNRDMVLGKLMLVVTEISEAAEAVRHGDDSNFREELADVFIRLMDITAACGIDIEQEIKSKMAANHNRPFKHGKLCSL